jgi:hypothetical protein
VCAPETSLRGRPACREHFYEFATKELREYQRDLAVLPEAQQLTVPGFLSEVISQTTLLVSHSKFLSDVQRDQFLQLSFSAIELYKRVRRSPRIARIIQVDLFRDSQGRQSHEITKTVDVSRKGACVVTKNSWGAGEEFLITSLQARKSARARVAWFSNARLSEGRLGLEILDVDDFWELNNHDPNAKKK